MTEIINQVVKNDSKKAQREEKILLYKANNIKNDIVETLKDVNAALTITYRKNTLDKAICVIRDCFQKSSDASFGHQVYSNGTKANLCFSRRKSRSTEPVQAMITDEDRLVMYLKSHIREHQVSLNKYSYFLTPLTMPRLTKVCLLLNIQTVKKHLRGVLSVG